MTPLLRVLYSLLSPSSPSSQGNTKVMPAESVRWNNDTRVTEPEGMQRIFPQLHRKYEPIDLVDKERRYLKTCNRFQILVADVNYHTDSGIKQLERRFQKHLSGTLPYRHMTTEKLLSIATARGIVVPHEPRIESGRLQLILLLQDSDYAAGPFKLLALPPELRAEIFSLVVLSEYETSYSPGPVLPDFPPLLFVNQQVRREAGEIFMQSRQIVLPCTINPDVIRACPSESVVTISAPGESLEWLRMAGLDLLPRIRSCLMVHRVTELLYRSYVYNIDSIGGTRAYHTCILGQIEGTPLLDNRGLYLLDLDAPIESQLNLGQKDVSQLKLSEKKAGNLVESFQSWEEQTPEDVQRSKYDGAAILLNWL